VTTEAVVQFFDAHPFSPFTMILADVRELHAQRADQVGIGDHALTVIFAHPARQLEIVDTALIVSLRTIYPAPRVFTPRG